MFKVKEIFYSLQGEGRYAGTPSVFCRFSGCNKWSGLPQHKAKSVCHFCDTDFAGGSSYSEYELIDAISASWPGGGRPRVVFTGGEPALQLTKSLIMSVKHMNFAVAVETNGSVELPDAGPMWITVSPKDHDFVLHKGSEIKLLWPHTFLNPKHFEKLDFQYFFIQPIDGVVGSTETALDFVLANPLWSLSLQQHKILDIR